MHERELRAFVATADTGRMDRAADALGYSQPAISYQIKCLEQELGMQLFGRRPNGLVLNSNGAMVLPFVRAALALIDGIKAMATHTGEVEAPTLREAG